MKSIYTTAFILFVMFSYANAQNIETIRTIPKPGFSGGLNVGSQFYSVDGIDARRSPFSYVVAGNLRFKWGLVNIPVSFSFRDQNLSYGASFNKFGMSPYYKWAKLHLGHRSMRFSKYSLNGKNFFGVGTELTPSNFRLAAFTGTIRNHLAQRDTIIFGTNLVPSYDRRATGIKVGYGNRLNHFDLIYLKIKDDTSESIDVENIAEIPLNPADNLVLGTEWRVQLIRQLSFQGSINASAFTSNASLGEIEGEGMVKTLGALTSVNPSTQASIAGDLGLQLNLSAIQFGLNYKRIEPNYRSLGIPFIQADIEAYTANTNFSLLDRKVTFSIQGGVEQNNLRKLDYLTRNRVIASINSNIFLADGFTANVHYSNYQYETTDGLVQVNDTLRYVGVNRSLGANISYNTKGEEFKYGIFTFVNRMSVEDLSPIQSITQQFTTFTLNLGTNLLWVTTDFSVRPALIYNAFDFGVNKQNTIGLSTRVSKSFFDKKLKSSFDTRFTYNTRDGNTDGRVWSNSISLSYKVNPMNSIQVNLGLMNRSSISRPDYSEFRGNVNYGLRF